MASSSSNRPALLVPMVLPRPTLLLTLLAALAILLAGPALAENAVEVEIDGLQGKLLTNVRAHLQLLQDSKEGKLTPATILYLHQRAPADIRAGLAPYGYYNVRIDASLKQSPAEHWSAIYKVDPGPLTRLTEVDVQVTGPGAELKEFRRAIADFPLKDGSTLDQPQYEQARDQLLATALSLGYANASMVRKQILVDPENNSAEIHLHLDTGDRYRIGAIRFHQDAITPELLRLYTKNVGSGDVYTRKQLSVLQRDLISSGYFSDVEIDSKLAEATDDAVPVDVTLTPVKHHKLTFGIGVDSDIGPNGTARWQDRLLNQRGHRTELYGKLSVRDSRLRAAYWIPGKDPRTDRFAVVGTLEREKTDSRDSKTLDLDLLYYFEWKKWRAKVYTEQKFERFEVGSEPRTDTRLLSIGGEIERTVVHKSFFPRHGWFLHSGLSGSPGLLSDTSYVRGEVRSRILFPVGKRGRIDLRGQVAAAQVSNFDNYPATLRYFAGGNDSVRGYEYKSLGPEDKDGDVIGGRNVLTGSFEYNHKVAADWVAAGFIDFGNAFNDEIDKVYVGSGFGAAWRSPFGAVRLYLAWPMNKGDNDPQLSDVRIHFGFGAVL